MLARLFSHPLSDLLNLKTIFSIFKETLAEWNRDQAPRLAAALSYYMLFSLAPLLIIAVAVASLFFQQSQVSRQLFTQIAAVIGSKEAETIMSWLNNRAAGATGGVIATALGVAVLLFGASGTFSQLQDSLNAIWDVEAKKGRGVVEVIKDRLLSFAMVLVIGLLLMVSMILSAAIALIATYFSGLLPGSDVLLQAVEFIITFAIIALLFALIFKVLPDVRVTWRSALFGGLFTALLFNIGKLLIGLYLGKTSVASSYGAAGSLVVILLWLYYSAMILFFGAEFTQVHTRRTKPGIEPVRGARRIGAKAHASQEERLDAARFHVAEPYTPPEAPQGLFAITTLSILAIAGGLLALLRLTPGRRG